MSSDLVLVTGGAGFIGCHTALALLERGYRVRVLDRLEPPIHKPGVVPPWLPNDVEVMVGDVRSKQDLAKALAGVSGVVHLAAHQDYLPDFSTFFYTNTVGTALLYELVVEGRLDIRRIVLASSQAVYGEGRYRCSEHGDFHPDLRSAQSLDAGLWEIDCPACGQPAQSQPTDEEQVKPQNQYALSKYTQEMVGFSIGKRYGIPTTALRYSITQGRWQSPYNAYSGICRIFTVRARAQKPLIVFEDGQQLRDYVYVGDVAEANVLALEDPSTESNAYNVGGGEVVSTIQYADILRRIFELPQPAETPGIYRFGDTRHIVSDTTKLRSLGWRPTRGVGEMIRDYAAWIESTGYIDENTDESLARMLALGTLRRVRSGWLTQPTSPNVVDVPS